MNSTDTTPVLVIGATGRVGREVVAQLRRAERPVRALTRRPATSALPADVEIMVGDLTVPESLEPAVEGVRVVFLVWTAAFATSPAVEEGHVGGDYVVTGPESLSQADQVRAIGHAIGRRLRLHELSPDEFRRETAELFPERVVDMLLAAWGAAAGMPAYVTSTVAEVTGTPARPFGEWAAAHAGDFEAPTRSDRH